MAALLEMNTSPAESEQAADGKIDAKPPMRFTYASGSRPLDGYTIKRGVGRGGFGEVYFAVSDAGKEVALKLIRRNLEVELRGVTHCLNLKHPNLVALFDIRTDEHDDRWVVMEYVAGESLEDLIDRYPQGMPPDVAMRWFEGICSAVAYLHDHGIVHRDLKPANIFIDDGTIKIGDYGLSKFISCSRRSGQTESVGTVHYMAPEIANGRYGREIDSYALGIILYEMVTGRVPFEGESVGEVLMKHLTAEPNLDAIDEPFRTVVRGAMAKDPERRINSAADMMAMLRGEAAGGLAGAETVAAKPQAARHTPYTAPRVLGRVPPIPDPNAFFHRDPEPIWASLKTAWCATRADLNYRSWPVTGRIAFGVVCVMGLVASSRLWMPVLWVALVAYVGYRVVRVIVRAATEPPKHMPPAPQPAADTCDSYEMAKSFGDPVQHGAQRPVVAGQTAHHVAPGAPWRRRGQAGWRQAAYQELAARPLRDRTSSVLGSMLAAGVVGPIAALLTCLFSPSASLELGLWTAIVATGASWAIMAPGQLAEGRLEDHAPLRFSYLLLGALVGVVAWAAAELLMLNLPASRDFSVGPSEVIFAELFPSWKNEPLQAAYGFGAVDMPMPRFAAYFAFLFVVLRWWRLAEWTRPSRVSLWSVAWCAFIGWAMTFFWWFPQPLGLVLAAVIAFTVQLSSPWLSPSRRRELAQKVAI